MTRSERNHNPGNLRLTRDRWQGQVLPPPDPDFVTFRSDDYGYRALFVVLEGYMLRHNLRTIRGIISRYAPRSENDTQVYIRHVSYETGWGPDDPLDPCGRVLQELARAIVRVETGKPADEDALRRGYHLYETRD